MDWLFYAVMGLFALMMFWIAFDDRIHTGLIGTLGAGGAGVQSLRIMDDSVLRSFEGTQSAILLLVACMACLVATCQSAGNSAPVDAALRCFEGVTSQPIVAHYNHKKRDNRRATSAAAARTSGPPPKVEPRIFGS